MHEYSKKKRKGGKDHMDDDDDDDGDDDDDDEVSLETMFLANFMIKFDRFLQFVILSPRLERLEDLMQISY